MPPEPSPPRDTSEESLRALLASIAAGDSSALAALYDRTCSWVLATAEQVLGDRQIAEEVTVDAFMQVWERAETYDSARARVGTWLLTIARSRALDRLRRLRSSTDLVQTVGAMPPERARTPDPSGAEEREEVERALDALPADQRRAIRLAFFPGSTHTEVARHLGEPLGTIKTRIRTGLRTLRTTLAHREHDR